MKRGVTRDRHSDSRNVKDSNEKAIFRFFVRIYKRYIVSLEDSATESNEQYVTLLTLCL